jgi:hypothetical protein
MERLVMVGSMTARVYSDADFDVKAICVHCGQPVRREVGGQRVHPALAIATEDTGHDFSRAVTLCSACLDRGGLDTCQLAAMGRVSDFDELCFRYQLVGTARQREELKIFIDVLDFLTTVLDPMLSL